MYYQITVKSYLDKDTEYDFIEYSSISNKTGNIKVNNNDRKLYTTIKIHINTGNIRVNR